MDSRFGKRLLLLKMTMPLLGSVLLAAMILISAARAESRFAAAKASDSKVFIPFSTQPMSAEPIPPPIPISVTEVISVPVLADTLAAEGRLLGLNKIGFHTGIDGNTDGLDEWMQALDAAGVPIFLKSADNAEPLYKAQELAKISGVPHTLVYRKTGQFFDTPNYEANPKAAAESHWSLHKSQFPPELDPSMVWIETVNEVDKGRSEWLAQFALETAKLAIADGFKWAAFGWSSGEPGLEDDDFSDWESEAMLEFLRFAAGNRDKVAIALHEYSYEVGNIGAIYPFRVGRFQELFRICDKHGIDRPTVLITEWGWEYQDVPDPGPALNDIAWASWLYAAYPEVKGAAIWYLGGNFGGIADQTQLLIAPVQEYSLLNYFSLTPGKGRVDPSLFAPTMPVPPPPADRPADRPGR